jgi:hypothetical protein
MYVYSREREKSWNGYSRQVGGAERTVRLVLIRTNDDGRGERLAREKRSRG